MVQPLTTRRPRIVRPSLTEWKKTVDEFDAEWHVDHDTTVCRWDEEMDRILTAEQPPPEIRDGGIVAIHDLVHHIMMIQVGDERAIPGTDPQETVAKYLAWIGQVCLWRLYVATSPRRVLWSRWLRSSVVAEIVGGNRELMITKNRNYGSSWSVMRSSDITGTLHTKSHRITELESGTKNEHESVEDNYRDILNYSIFALIRLSMER